MDPKEFIITRKRKKYKFAIFANSPLCFEVEEWSDELQPRVLEMGAGTGLFSVALAWKSPEKQHVAVDVKADQLLDLLTPHSFENIWVTFPDPFPKDRSSKHRLTHPQYLKVYAELLETGGTLYFKTDAKDLFTWSLEQFVSEGWTLKELTFNLHESSLLDSYKVKTTYETRYTGEGLKIHFVKAMPPA